MSFVSFHLYRQQVFSSHLLILYLCQIHLRVCLNALFHGSTPLDDLTHELVLIDSNLRETSLIRVELQEQLRELLCHFFILGKSFIDA